MLFSNVNASRKEKKGLTLYHVVDKSLDQAISRHCYWQVSVDQLFFRTSTLKKICEKCLTLNHIVDKSHDQAISRHASGSKEKRNDKRAHELRAPMPFSTFHKRRCLAFFLETTANRFRLELILVTKYVL